MKQTILALAGLVSLVQGHGFISKPSPRMPGSAMQSTCGQQVYNNQKSDNYGNVQGELQVAQGQDDYNAEKCNIWLCKGFKFADNKDNVQSYTPGQTVKFEIDIRAPHTGVANVSVVDTASNSVIGSPLKSWKNYASTESGITEDDTDFSVTIPEDLGSKCSSAGDCVLQWYWFAESIDQTYESCVDFTVGGSDSGSSSGSTTTAAANANNANTNNKVAVPTTMATSAKQQTAPTSSATPAAEASIPEDGSSEEKVNWVSNLVRSIVNYGA